MYKDEKVIYFFNTTARHETDKHTRTNINAHPHISLPSIAVKLVRTHIHHAVSLQDTDLLNTDFCWSYLWNLFSHSVFLFLCLSLSLSLILSVGLWLPVSVFVCLCLSVCLSVCLCLSVSCPPPPPSPTPN